MNWQMQAWPEPQPLPSSNTAKSSQSLTTAATYQKTKILIFLQQYLWKALTNDDVMLIEIKKKKNIFTLNIDQTLTRQKLVFKPI